MASSPRRTAVSLFSGGGIGDLALSANGLDVLVASELRPDRASVFEHNFPDVAMVCGDLADTKDEVLRLTKELLQGETLDILFATPPCQGMSKNGRGKLLQRLGNGERVLLDPRNQLVLHALDIASALRPRIVAMENVPEMANTVIEDREGNIRPILDIVRDALGDDYRGHAEVVEFADYGVPQRRKRLISVWTKTSSLQRRLKRDASLLPPRTHAQHETPNRRPWVTVADALADLPALDASTLDTATSTIPFHRVPLLDADKYYWVSHTPEGGGAFDNQCAEPTCGYQGNRTHGSGRDAAGVNRSHRTTPIRCERCDALLPRPWVREADGTVRLMSGYTSAYKRMKAGLPASALTRNLSYACSDHKLHPTQHRVLSLHEAFILHTIADYPYRWARADGKRLSDKTVREIIGESIPPMGLERIFASLCEGLNEDVHPTSGQAIPGSSNATSPERQPCPSQAFPLG